MNKRANYLKSAYYIAVFTIVYNLLEAVVSLFFGLKDETLTLFGFGIDSLIESLSATGILFMVIQMKKSLQTDNSRFEQNALKITGWSFYVLSVGLIAGAVLSIINRQVPHSALAGVAISLISIGIMIFLVVEKKRLGKALNSDALIADANCNLVCIYMSLILLVSSACYEYFRLPYIDAAGTMGLAFFSIREGHEAFEKSRTGQCHCEKH